MTIERTGRTTHSDGATATITISPVRGGRASGDPLFILHGADLRMDDSGYHVVQVKHPTGTDFEHDSATIVHLGFWGIRFKQIWCYAQSTEFEGYLKEAQYYDDGVDPTQAGGGYHDPGQMCDGECCHGEPHPLMEYRPPEQKIQPQPVLIEVSFRKEEVT